MAPVKPATRHRISPVLSVGDVAARTGLAVSAIHFYERQGLIRSIRTQGNQRRFHRGVLRRIGIIKVAQRTGIPLAEIREALSSLPIDRPPTGRDWQRLSSRWRDDLNVRIEQLTRLRDQLGDCIGCGCLSLSDCPLRNPDDYLAKDGPGARLLEGAAGDVAEDAVNAPASDDGHE
ncbi:redox-sensitive transcriptional activator SoxR [Thalassospira marina]|uniref:Redox-sensitive transcriptional activator SoxR n=1 Tax=Thalassospira marina TaxID=2048283 RepID=A0ABM6Q5P0_9PROT|nr:redox-sensitive transcriptional activator SoxR [Thalassospira marina]AUG51824.1 redox-sensitive transcriptional activator SoxR [Thalassospira marina]